MNPAKHLAICAEIQQQYESRIKVLLDRIAKLQTQRQPLTNEQRDAIARQAADNDWHDYEVIDAVEAAHGIKGEA